MYHHPSDKILNCSSGSRSGVYSLTSFHRHGQAAQLLHVEVMTAHQLRLVPVLLFRETAILKYIFRGENELGVDGP